MTSETLETQQTNASPKLKPWLIDSSVAQARGKAGAQARIANQLLKDKELEQAKARLETLQPLLNNTIAQAIANPIGSDEEYRLRSLTRTREQIEKLEQELDKCSEPKDLKFIVDAIARMRGVEQVLAKRPTPGSYRPVREKPTKSQASSGPIDD